MIYNFNTPQRQSAAGIVIMTAHTLQQTIRILFIPFIVFIVKADSESLNYIAIGAGILMIWALVYAYLSYRKFTFYLDPDKQEFVIHKGIFNRTLLTIQLEKIQQVNINQSFLQKVIGVYSLQIDTAGADKKEVSIKAIDEHIAYSLKEQLLSGKAMVEERPKVDQKASFLKLSPSTLFKIGFTSNYGSSIALLIGFAYALFHNTKELLRAFDMDNGQIETAVSNGFNLSSTTLLIISLFILLLSVNIIRTFIKYYDFEINVHQLSLSISSGLFAKKNTLLSPQKVQVTAYSQNYFQKKLNILNMNLKQANAGKEEEEKEQSKSNIAIPGCNTEERDQLLKLILGKIPSTGKTFVPNYRFINLPLIFKVLLPLGIFLIFSLNFTAVKPFYPMALIYLLVSILMIYRSYQQHRLMVNQEFIIKKSGIWDISHEIILPHQIQAITTFQYPWHKGVDVGHVNLHTAAGVIHFKYGNYTEIKQLVNYWLYQIESESEFTNTFS